MAVFTNGLVHELNDNITKATSASNESGICIASGSSDNNTTVNNVKQFSSMMMLSLTQAALFLSRDFSKLLLFSNIYITCTFSIIVVISIKVYMTTYTMEDGITLEPPRTMHNGFTFLFRPNVAVNIDSTMEIVQHIATRMMHCLVVNPYL